MTDHLGRHASLTRQSLDLLLGSHALGIRFARLLWKELFEFRSRPILLGMIVALSIGATVAAGNLNIQPATAEIQLYSPISTSTVSPDTDAAQAIIEQFSNVHVIRMNEGSLNLAAMQRDGAHFAVVQRAGKWVVFYSFPTYQQETEAAWFVNLLSTSLNEGKPLIADSTQSTIKRIGLSSRISAMPGNSQILLVPRTISLVVLFLPFVLSARSFSREVSFGTLPTILSAPSGGWFPLLAAKAIASGWVSASILLVLILVIRPLFGIAPKPGVAIQLGAQSLAIMTSAVLGLFAMVWSRNYSQIYISVSLYFLILVLLSGFLFPLETASPIIRAASNVSPLTYSARIFESWLFYGTDARVFTSNIIGLTIQLIFATLALIIVSWFARRQI